MCLSFDWHSLRLSFNGVRPRLPLFSILSLEKEDVSIVQLAIIMAGWLALSDSLTVRPHLLSLFLPLSLPRCRRRIF